MRAVLSLIEELLPLGRVTKDDSIGVAGCCPVFQAGCQVQIYRHVAWVWVLAGAQLQQKSRQLTHRFFSSFLLSQAPTL